MAVANTITYSISISFRPLDWSLTAQRAYRGLAFTVQKLFFRMAATVAAPYLRFRRGREHLRRKQQDAPDV